MKQCMKKVLLMAILLFVFIAQCLAANSWSLGPYQLVNGVSSGPLNVTMNGKRSLSSYGFVGSVGGVAFESVAEAGASLRNKPIAISYNSDKADGYRLIITIEETSYQPYLPDWQLVPIAKYANSDYNACVSLFGPKTQNSRYDIVYHEAFENTLLGLRLLQADIMLMNLAEFWKLPAMDSQIVLGLGETEPDSEGWQDSAMKINKIMGKDTFQSWVCTDCDENVQFYIENDQFVITGFPYYYFWKSDFENYRQKYQQYLKQAEQLRKNGKIKEYNVIVAKINSLEPQVFEVTTLTSEMKKNTQTIQAFNPTVYTAVNQTMRYAAFFRYIKAANIDIWNKFLSQVQNVPVAPKVKTPTLWDKSKH